MTYELALESLGRLRHWEERAGSFEEIINEINTDRPLCASIKWSGGGTHAVVIIGYNCDLNMIMVADPGFGGSISYHSFSAFKTAYNNSGTWYETQWVQ